MNKLIEQYLIQNEFDRLEKIKKDITINPQKYYKDNKRFFTEDEVKYLKLLANKMNEIIVKEYAHITKPKLNEGDKITYNDIQFTCVAIEDENTFILERERHGKVIKQKITKEDLPIQYQ